jgi:ParB family chromosome partitioning protein
MSVIEKSSSRPRIVNLDPNKISIPDVRVTSTWDPELLEMFKKDIEGSGIEQPLLLAKEGKTFWLVDGLHRLEEAKLQGLKRVPCVVREMGMRDVLLKNLKLNRLRGGTKASEMVRVMNELTSKHGLGIEDIVKETGFRRDYVEKLLETARAEAEVLEALDREEISVSHAWEISRVPNRDIQLRLLGQVFTYRLAAKDLHNVVNDTLEILHKRQQLEKKPSAPEPTAIPTVKCHLCENEWPIRKVVGINICMACYGIAHEAITKAKKEGRIPTQQQLAIEVTEPLSHEILTKERPKIQQNLKGGTGESEGELSEGSLESFEGRGKSVGRKIEK